MDKTIIEKILKLIALSKSCNENEARVAILRVQEMLAKYKLSMKEVSEVKIFSSNIKEGRSKIRFTKAKWKANLAKLIAENFGCYMYFKTNRTNTIVFFGREEDITVCTIVLEYAVDCIAASVKRLQAKYRAENTTFYNPSPSVKGFENDYAAGFIDGLRDNFEEQKRKHQEWGLVLMKDPEVIEAHAQIKFKRTINTRMQYNGHDEAAVAGYEEGKSFSISDKIANTQEEAPQIEV